MFPGATRTSKSLTSTPSSERVTSAPHILIAAFTTALPSGCSLCFSSQPTSHNTSCFGSFAIGFGRCSISSGCSNPTISENSTSHCQSTSLVKHDSINTMCPLKHSTSHYEQSMSRTNASSNHDGSRCRQSQGTRTCRLPPPRHYNGGRKCPKKRSSAVTPVLNISHAQKVRNDRNMTVGAKIQAI